MSLALSLLLGLPVFIALLLWFTEWAETHLLAGPERDVARPGVAPPRPPATEDASAEPEPGLGSGVPPAA